MRIVHVTDCYLPRLGGIEMHVHDLAERQRHDGHEVQILTTTPATRGGGPDPWWVHRVGPGNAMPHSSASTATRASAVLAGADVLHAHVSVVSPFAFGTARRAALSGVPTLVTVHSMWSRLGIVPALGGSLVGLRSWPVQWSAVSEQAAQPVRRALGADRSVLVLPNAVDPANWHVPRVTPAIPTIPTIVSVMRLARIKRPLPLAAMLRRVRADLPESFPMRAVIIGDGPQRRPLERYLHRHRMNSWVDLPGRLERDAIGRVFARSSLYVAPALLESFGIAALEARTAGLPVVASTHGGVVGFITPGVNGLLADTDQGMVGAMVRLLTDEPCASAIAAHNRTTDTGLDWQTVASMTARAYAGATDVARGRRVPASSPLVVTHPGLG